MPYSDPEEQRLAQHRHYETHKSEYLHRTWVTKEAKRAWLREQKSAPCMDCGIQYPYYVMHFDHRDAPEKLGNVAAFTVQSWDKLRTEVAKCDLVCGNCHAERTHQRSML